jgi:glycosyltransferase involved in cell wall biosynthesis
LVGNKNYFYQRLENETNCQNIIFPGFVPDDQISSYYKNATAYVFPSLYEGFGLPPLEAMTHGTPVISSNSSCLPEILGQSVLYFDPKDKGDLQNKLEELIKTPELAEILAKNGQNQLKKYSWDTMGRAILDIYNSQK